MNQTDEYAERALEAPIPMALDRVQSEIDLLREVIAMAHRRLELIVRGSDPVVGLEDALHAMQSRSAMTERISHLAEQIESERESLAGLLERLDL